MLQSGDLTQLEWVDLCASELKLDGVDFGAAHFPRTDADYLAQLKKLCTDRGLTVAALTVEVPFGEGDVDRQTADLGTWVERASLLGAPLVRVACGAIAGSPGIAWRELIRGFKLACATAKERNVTFALQSSEATLVATPSDARRCLKECDSAWLRLAPTTAQLTGDLAQGWRELMNFAVLLIAGGSAVDSPALGAAREAGYIGFVTVESSNDVSRALGPLRQFR
jgi:xylose isomerase-like TIM barrel protein